MFPDLGLIAQIPFFGFMNSCNDGVEMALVLSGAKQSPRTTEPNPEGGPMHSLSVYIKAYVSVQYSNVHIHVVNVFYFYLSGGYFYLKCGIHTTTSKCIHSTSLVFPYIDGYVFQVCHLGCHIHIVNVFYFFS